MSVRSKAYRATLPASYTEDDLGKIERWSFDNCYRAAIVRTGDSHAVWVAVREKTWSKGDWMRHIRDVFNNNLLLDVRPLAGDGWLALCVDVPEALDMIRRATGRRTRPVEPHTRWKAWLKTATRATLKCRVVAGVPVSDARAHRRAARS